MAAAIISLAIPGSLDQAGAIDLNARKDDAQTVNILASCASDIMLSRVQFELNVVNPDKIRRLFPGMEDMEIFYYRCQILRSCPIRKNSTTVRDLTKRAALAGPHGRPLAGSHGRVDCTSSFTR